MPSSADRGTDPLKEYWWLLLVAVLFIGAWLTLSSPTGTGSDNVVLAGAHEAAAEQSLRSLDSAENPSGAPGSTLGMPGARTGGSAAASAGASGQSGSLYEAPGAAAGSPIPAGAGEEIEAAARGQRAGGGTSLADALRGVASGAGKAPDNGWGGATPRSGFSKPKADFGQVGASRTGGSGSTSASLVTVDKAFGTGGNPGLNLGPGLDRAAADAKGRIAAGMQGGAGIEGLKAARQTSLDALKQGDEMAAGRSRQSFDGGAAGRTAMQQLRASGGGAGGGDDESVPMNLKANDPSKLTNKEFEPPPLTDTKKQEDPDNKQYMQQQMMMMMLGIAMTGILGPMAGGMGMMMFQTMGGMMPPANMNHNVGAKSG